MNMELVDVVAAIAGAILSIVFEFFPVVSTWFAGLSKGMKQLVFGALAFLIAAVMFGLACANLLAQIFPQFAITCDIAGAWALLHVVIVVVGGAQLTHITINKLINKAVKS